MKRKICILILIVVIVIGIILWKKNKMSNKENNEINNETESTQGIIFEIPEGADTEPHEIDLTSSKDKKLETEDIEITDLKVNYVLNDVSVTTSIKNKKAEEINGYTIMIDLLDKNENVITTLEKISKDIIAPNEEIQITYGIPGLEKVGEIVSAKINSFQKGTIENNINDKMEEQINGINQ